MVQKSGGHQLRLVAYPIIYDGIFTSQVVSQNDPKWSIPTLSDKSPNTFRMISHTPTLLDNPPTLSVSVTCGFH